MQYGLKGPGTLLKLQALFCLSKSIFYVKNYRNLSKKNFIEEYFLGAHFLLLTFFENFKF